MRSKQLEVQAAEEQVRQGGGATGRACLPACLRSAARARCVRSHAERVASHAVLVAEAMLPCCAGPPAQVQQLEARIKEAAAATDKVQKEYNSLSEKVVKLHHDLEEQVHQNSQLMADNSARQVGRGQSRRPGAKGGCRPRRWRVVVR